MIRTSYSDLPETMESRDIEEHVSQLLDITSEDQSISQAFIAEALIQLIERQAYNYESFSDHIVHRIQEWITKVWSDDDPSLADALCTIIVNVPTTEGRRLLETALTSKNPQIRLLADETLEELPTSETD